MIRTVIIDDELHCTSQLAGMLSHQYPDEVSLEEICHTAEKGYESLLALKPELVFLDIQLNGATGFDLLKRLPRIDFEVIFTTAFDKYAIEAFRFSAVDYLLKPIAPEDLGKAVDKFITGREKSLMVEKFEMLLHNLRHLQSPLRKIGIPTMDGLEYIEVSEVVRCQADVNYTVLHLKSGRRITVSKTLKEFESLLSDCGFFRVHHSHLVNLQYVTRYSKGKGGYVTLLDNTELDVSMRKKEALLKRLQAKP